MIRPERASKNKALRLMFDASDEESNQSNNSGSESVDGDSEESDNDQNTGTNEEEDTSELDNTSNDNEYRWRHHIRPITVSVPDNSFSPPPEEPLTPLQYFNMFLSEEMIEKLTEETNRYSVEKNRLVHSCYTY